VSRHDALVLLIALGAAFEVLGLVLVAADVYSAGRRSRKLAESATQVVLVGAALARAIADTIAVGDKTAPEREPTVEERVAALERRAAGVDERVSGVKTELERRIERVEDKATRRATEARQEALDAAREARKLLAKELGAHLWMRWLGAGFFVAGLVLNTLGNVWSI
jgi:hypothetical protein